MRTTAGWPLVSSSATPNVARKRPWPETSMGRTAVPHPVDASTAVPVIMAVPLTCPSSALTPALQLVTKSGPLGICVPGLPRAGPGKVTPAADDGARDMPGWAAPTDAGEKASGPPTMSPTSRRQARRRRRRRADVPLHVRVIVAHDDVGRYPGQDMPHSPSSVQASQISIHIEGIS